MGTKKHNAWSGLTAKERADRIRRMTEARTRNRAIKAIARPLTIVSKEFEEHDVGTTQGAQSIDSLAALIISVWRHLNKGG